MILSVELIAKLEGGSKKPAICFFHRGLDFSSVTGACLHNEGRLVTEEGSYCWSVFLRNSKMNKKQRGFGVLTHLCSIRS